MTSLRWGILNKSQIILTYVERHHFAHYANGNNRSASGYRKRRKLQGSVINYQGNAFLRHP